MNDFGAEKCLQAHTGHESPLPYNISMASQPRYTDVHARAGLDHPFPAIETWQNQFPGYEIQIDDP